MSRASISFILLLACMLLAGCSARVRDEQLATATAARENEKLAEKDCKNVLSKDDVIKMNSRELSLAAHAANLAYREWMRRPEPVDPCLRAQAFQKDYLERLAESWQRIEINQQMEDARKRR